jgi:hypothetical protein
MASNSVLLIEMHEMTSFWFSEALGAACFAPCLVLY